MVSCFDGEKFANQQFSDHVTAICKKIAVSHIMAAECLAAWYGWKLEVKELFVVDPRGYCECHKRIHIQNEKTGKEILTYFLIY